jgi:hypothetical protein
MLETQLITHLGDVRFNSVLKVAVFNDLQGNKEKNWAEALKAKRINWKA